MRASAAVCCSLAVLIAACSGPAPSSPLPATPSLSPPATDTAAATPLLVTPPPRRDYPATALPGATVTALQAALDTALTAQGGVGASAAVLVPGEGTWTGASGSADLASGRAVTPETRFAIASITKTFIATLVLELQDAGEVDLDAPIRRYLSDLPDTVTAGVTVRELLNHTAGVADYVDDVALLAAAAADPTRGYTTSELLARIGPPSYPPGTSWRYSNSDYLILGLLVERVSGSSLDELLRARFFAPLGLTSLVYQPARPPAPPLALGYSVLGRGADGDTWADDGYLPNRALATIASSAGGIAGTALDVARWGAALYAGPVLPPPALTEMLTFVPSVDYGLGVELRTLGSQRAIGHNGRTMGFATALDCFTRSGVVVAVLANSDRLNVDAIVRALAGALPT